METKLKELEQQMCDPAVATQPDQLEPLAREQAAVQKKLDALYETWEGMAL